MARNPYYQGPISDHFDGVRFFQPGGARDKSRLDLLKWLVGSKKAPGWPAYYPSPFPQRKPPRRVEGARLRVTFVGHSSFLIQTRGKNLLIDPVWVLRASPLRFAGPKRVNAPGVKLEDLPELDAILLSHNHYDHMDLATLTILTRNNKTCRVITPLGNDFILRRHDRTIRAEAYDWGAKIALGDNVAVTLTPSLHWSARSLSDRRMALWSGFLLHTPDGDVYYAGDTAYGDGGLFRSQFAEYGAPRLALLPIGAYAPRWFMRDQHVDPFEAVAIFRDLQAQQAFGYHWGTFRLTDEPIDEPPRLLAQALAQANIAPERFVAGRPGEVLELE